eukprot:2784623-Rhodomonas_salina.4
MTERVSISASGPDIAFQVLGLTSGPGHVHPWCDLLSTLHGMQSPECTCHFTTFPSERLLHFAMSGTDTARFRRFDWRTAREKHKCLRRQRLSSGLVFWHGSTISNLAAWA